MKTTTNTENEPTITWVLETKFKDLTDEEIAVIWANYSVPMTGMEFKKVVEAILRKAQEK